MLVDVLRTCAEGLLDRETGLNHRIAQINHLKNTKAPPVRKFEVDRYPLPTQMAQRPVLVQTVPSGEIGELSQGKRKNKWRVEWHWWDAVSEPDTTVIAATMDAMVLVADSLCGQGTILLADEMRLEVGGFEGQDRFWSVMRFGFRVIERDEYADIDQET